MAKKSSKKHPGGRPSLFKSAKEMQGAIDAYFEDCDNRKRKVITKDGDEVEVPDPRPYTICGIANSLGMTRQTLLNYEKTEQFFDTIKRAKEKVHQFNEESLHENRNAAGVIFSLKNNFGWQDKSETVHTFPESVKIEFI